MIAASSRIPAAEGAFGSSDCRVDRFARLRAVLPARAADQASGFCTNAVRVADGEFAQLIDAHLLKARDHRRDNACDSEEDSTFFGREGHIERTSLFRRVLLGGPQVSENIFAHGSGGERRAIIVE